MIDFNDYSNNEIVRQETIEEFYKSENIEVFDCGSDEFMKVYRITDMESLKTIHLNVLIKEEDN